MRTILATAALTLALAAPASAEFFPIEQPPPPPPCNDTVSRTSDVAAAQCAAAAVVPVTRLQVKLIVAYKVRAVWGAYAAGHIRRYGCDLYRLPDETGQTATSCMTAFRSRHRHLVTRQLVLSFGRAGRGVAGVTVSRFPTDEPGSADAPAPSLGDGPTATPDPTAAEPGPSFPSDG